MTWPATDHFALRCGATTLVLASALACIWLLGRPRETATGRIASALITLLGSIGVGGYVGMVAMVRGDFLRADSLWHVAGLIVGAGVGLFAGLVLVSVVRSVPRHRRWTTVVAACATVVTFGPLCWAG
ncbi:MAG: hypothetical protein ACJ790_17070 [Myxococcaceae bacterium]